ncbi:dTDP-4-dehydrorhamnose reductase [Brevundimonas vesicularis]|uniref:dTDP-4-dehydrorhamnose reductase n=2 Tax=Brevundimonas vesicularis TaxID=41276 RepID=A0A1Z3U7Y3_BREVE|nr:dTDP-4-dehydrorhamnose reductase [Brevundimonas vesicularis]ASE39407.1 dTDP-4-dehydrorhamnose reductase [Brevundimonas vesicularis]MDX2335368.1 dTDP-4-dehydrorhamnose reductase [Brevundimonas vesicularis]
MNATRADVLVTGANGQLGSALKESRWPTTLRPQYASRHVLDITSHNSVAKWLDNSSCQIIINAAAYTAVDRAEQEVEQAFLINSYGPAVLASEARKRNIALIHISTDYVFDGTFDRPYAECDQPHPINVYGASKLAGEVAALTVRRCVVLRTAWLISPFSENFARAIVKKAQMHEPIRVVSDQIGSPTHAKDVAEAITTIAARLANDEQCPTGIFHYVNSGHASRYELAHALLDHTPWKTPPTPSSTQDYNLPAQRPINSRLSNNKIATSFGIQPTHWRDGIPQLVDRLINMEPSQ